MFSFFKKWRSTSPYNRLSSDLSYQSFAVALTDVGEVRDNNEDNILFVKPHNKSKSLSKGSLAIVCDGMGGHNSGELASKIAIETVSKTYYDSTKGTEEALEEGLIKAHNNIKKTALRNPNHARMGTTCTALAIINTSVFIGHVGDSRAYHISGNNIKQITKDHSYVQHLYDKGIITKDEKANHPDRNIVTMVLGTQNTLLPDVYLYEEQYKNDDKLMICSDGLYEYVSDDEILSVISVNDMTNAAEILIDTVKQRGGHDNISIIIVCNQSESQSNRLNITQEIR